MAGSIDYDKFAAAIATALAVAMKGAGEITSPVPETGKSTSTVGGSGEASGRAWPAFGGVVEPGSEGESASEGEVGGPEARGVVQGRSADDTKSWSDVVAGGGSESSSEDGGSGGRVGEVARGEGTQLVVPTGPAGDTPGFMATYVRTEPVKQLGALLSQLCGHKIPKSAYGDLALTRFTAATIPSAFIGGRARYRALAVVGDAAALLAYTTRSYRAGGKLESVQFVKTALTDQVMARAFSKSVLAPHVVTAGDVNLSNSKVGATALEAFAAVLSMYCGQDAVLRYLVAMDLEGFVGN